MQINRRSVLIIPSVIAAGAALDRPQAQNLSDFDPVATARLRAGEIAREIAASPRDPSVAEPSRNELFYIGLLLQAGLRALLPVQARQGISLPGTPSPHDPGNLIAAQKNYKAVFESGGEATPAQKAEAIAALESATQQLRRAGYVVLAEKVVDWVRTQRP